jgi:hypothetical protein
MLADVLPVLVAVVPQRSSGHSAHSLDSRESSCGPQSGAEHCLVAPRRFLHELTRQVGEGWHVDCPCGPRERPLRPPGAHMYRHFRPLTRLPLADQGLTHLTRLYSRAAAATSSPSAPIPGPRRLARLRPEFADSYPGVTPNQWEPAAELADRVGSALARQPAWDQPMPGRALSSEHFDFRTES